MDFKKIAAIAKQPPNLTLLCVNDMVQYEVHQAIVCPASPLFARLVDLCIVAGATHPLIALHAHKSVVKRMLAYLYYGSYNDAARQLDIKSLRVENSILSTSAYAWSRYLQYLLDGDQHEPHLEPMCPTREQTWNVVFTLSAVLLPHTLQTTNVTSPANAETSDQRNAYPCSSLRVRLEVNAAIWHIAEIYGVPMLMLEATTRIHALLTDKPNIVLSSSFPKIAQFIWDITARTRGRGSLLRQEVLDATLNRLPAVLETMNDRSWNQGAEPGSFLRNLMEGTVEQYNDATRRCRGWKQRVQTEREVFTERSRNLESRVMSKVREMNRAQESLEKARLNVMVEMRRLQQAREELMQEKAMLRKLANIATGG